MGDANANQSDFRQSLQLSVHLVLLLVLRHLVFDVGNLTEANYSQPFLLPAVAIRLVTTLSGWGLIACLVAARTRLLTSWSELQHGSWLRGFAVGLACVLTLSFASQATNLYFGQNYLADRVCLILLSFAVWFRPILIAPFALCLIAFAGQFSHPIDGYGWDRHLLGVHRLEVQLLLIVIVGYVARPRRNAIATSQPTVLLIAVVLAASYFVPGQGKLRMGWVSFPTAHLSLFGAWSHGWLSDLSAEDIVTLTDRLRPASLLMQGIVLLAECGAVLILVRRAALILLPMWVAFHVGVWLLYGFSFWAWIAIDLAVFTFVLKRPDGFGFNWNQVAVACVLVVTSVFWLSPNRLAWFNTPLTNTYEVTAITSGGKKITIHPKALAPYDYIFTMQLFGGIATEPSQVAPYGATTSRATARLSGPEIAERQRVKTVKIRDPKLKAQLTSLLKRYGESWNRGRDNTFISGLSALPALLNSTRKNPSMTGRDIETLSIVRRCTYLRQGAIQSEVREECLRVDFD